MDTVQKYMELFKGRTDAYGLGEGRVEKRPVTQTMYRGHLEGDGTGLGIFPMLDSDEVYFAAIDLDEPDFDAAREMQGFLPGHSFIERSRSGNAHVWVFFNAPVEAWVPRGILRYATEAIGKSKIEVFPKQDRLLPGMVGNYINLPYHGNERPILVLDHGKLEPVEVDFFLGIAIQNDPADWRKRARWLEIPSPADREVEHAEFGSAPVLHICAEHIIAEREHNPVVEGHRAVVYFNLAKMLLNYEGFDHDEAEYYMKLVNDASPDPIQDWELERMLNNAERGQFTSTGCDDPLMSPYAHPDCPIANPRKK